MTTNISRFIVTLAAVLFAAIAVGFWVAPGPVAERFGIAAASVAGIVSLRADYGALFAAMALFCGAAVWTKRRSWAIAALVVVAAVVVGRMIGWVANGGPAGDFADLAVELVVIVALTLMIRGSRPEAEKRAVRPTWLAVAGAVVLVAAAGAVAALLNASVEQWIFDRAALQMTARVNTAPLADDALRVAVCGSSAPLPSASRAKACVAVFAGGKFYIVDVGPESVENLVLWGIPMQSIGGVLLTHYHSDHIGDLGELQLQTWAGGRPAQLAVYGGPGVEEVVAGFNQAYRQDQGYRTRHHGEKVMPSTTWGMVAHPVELDGAPTPAKDRTALVLEESGLRITAFEVDHAPITPAYAYRFDYKGRSAVVTGDLKYHAPLAKASKDADLLVSEAIAKQMTRSLGTAARSIGRDRAAAIMHDIEDYHITPEEAARIANDANVKLLVFYHLLPSPDGFLPRRLFSQGVNQVRPSNWTLAEDGSLYTLPIGSGSVQTGRVND